VFKSDLYSHNGRFRLRQHSTLYFFLRKNVALRATFFRKKMKSSALPEANQAVYPGEHLVWNRPRM
jgi:hypothetical protein